MSRYGRVAGRKASYVAGAAVASLALAACGSSSNAGKSDDATPVSGGTLSFAINTDADCLDPHQSATDVAGFFSRPILDSLVSLGKDGKLLPWLATEWSISADQKTYSFTLRSDVTFSDGTKFDAAAVKANLDHIVAPTTKSKLAASSISSYAGTTVVDATHVQIQLKNPNSALLPNLATSYFGIEAPSSLQQPTTALCSKIVGSGPYVSTGGYVKGKGIDYTRNPNYNWAPGTAAHKGAAYLDAVSVKTITEDAARYGALTSGQIDSIASVPPVNVSQLKSTSGFKIDTAAGPGGNYNYYPNLTKGVFTDANVRKAFREGIDWDTIVNKLYFGVFQPAKNPLSPATVGYDKSVASAYSYNQADANKLLDEAGWSARDSAGYRTKDGARLTLKHLFFKPLSREQRDVVADQVQAAAKQLGIEVVTTSPDAATYLKDLVSGNYDLYDYSWQRVTPDALRQLFGTAAISNNGVPGTNYSRFSDPSVDKDFADALGTTDLSKQAELYGDAQKKITDASAVFPVYVFNYVLGSSTKVHDLKLDAQTYPSFYDAWKN